ncbi:hypothetical protein JCM3774_001541 [Rhodotorula dairenensis]
MSTSSSAAAVPASGWPRADGAPSEESGEPPPAKHAHASMPETLPPVLENFLSRYPHPAFALRASSLFDALVLRSNSLVPAARDNPLSHSHSHSKSHSGSHSHWHSSSGGGNSAASVAATHPAEEGTDPDGIMAKPPKPTRLSSREQYEGMRTEEELHEDELDIEDERRGRDAAAAATAETEPGAQERSRSGSCVKSSLSPSASQSPPGSSLSASAPDAEIRDRDREQRVPGSPQSVSRTGTPTTISAVSNLSKSRVADVGSRPRAHARAERVLAATFGDSMPEYGPRRAGDRRLHQPLVRSTLLEGGAQKSHDPSRTAEGAVKAMYEQREKNARDEEEDDKRIARNEEELERERVARDDEWEAEAKLGAPGRHLSYEGNERGSGGRPEVDSQGVVSEEALSTEVEDQGSSSAAVQTSGDSSSHAATAHLEEPTPSRTSGSSKPATSAPPLPPRRRSGPRVGLREILSPVWRNGKWREMMSIRDDAKPTPPSRTSGVNSAGVLDKATGEAGPPEQGVELELLGVLSRTDAQECLAMLASVVQTLLPSHPDELDRQKQVPLAELNHTVLVELNFPESSIYRHPPGSSFYHEHTAADSFARDASVAGSSLFFSPSVSAARDQRRYAAAAGSASAASSAGQESPMPSISENQAEGGGGTPASIGSTNGSAGYFPRGAAAAAAASAGGASAIGQVVPATALPLHVPPSNQNPTVPPPHHTVQQESRLLRPFLQIVATLYEEYDLVICTTISGNMPLPVTVTGSPEPKDPEAAQRAQEAAKERENDKQARDQASQRREDAEHAQDVVDRQRAEELEVREPRPAPTPPPDSAKGGAENASHERPGLHHHASSDETSLAPPPPRPGLEHKKSSEETRVPAAGGAGARMPSRPPLAQRLTSTSNMSSAPSSATSTVVASTPTTESTRGFASTDSVPTEPARGLAPIDSPSGVMTDDLRALLSSESGRDMPADVLEEKESRAALRRQGIAHHASQREIDNVFREREWARRESRRRHKARGHEKKREPDHDGAGGRNREGLAELRELDEPGSENGQSRDGSGSSLDSAAEDEEADRDGILGFDEEDDDVDLDRLRRATRTGSTSSAGSAKDREEAEAEARLSRDQHNEDEEKLEIRRELTKECEDAAERERRAGGNKAQSRSLSPAPNGDAHRLPERAVVESPSTSPTNGQGPVRHRAGSFPQPFDLDSHAAASDAIDSARVSASRLTEDPHNLGGPIAPVTMAPSQSYGDPFFDVLASTDCGRTILTVDWTQTTLGEIDSWTQELRSHVMATLASPFHTALWLGEESVLLYNDAYARLLGAKHPAAMGKCGAEGWAEVWDVIGPLASQVMLGKTRFFQDQAYCIYRNGMLEETYMTWAYVTLRDGHGRIMGYTNPSFETTARVIAERRLGTLRELSQLTQLSRTSRDFCSKTLRALSSNPLDIPFALLYTCETLSLAPTGRTKGSMSTDSSSVPAQPRSNEEPSTSRSAGATSATMSPTTARLRLTLQGTIGVPKGHLSAPDEVFCLVDAVDSQDLPERSSASSASSLGGTHSSATTNETASSTVWPMVEALQTRKPVFISELGKRSDGFQQRGWPDPIRRAVVIPVLVEGSSMPKAVLIVGLNPRRPFNQVFSVFLNLISRTLSTGLLGIEVAEEQARKSKELADLNDARQAFFANISHELRTPLTLILGPLEDVLGSGASDIIEGDREKLQTVLRNAHRLHAMVNTLLDFSRLESGRMNAKFRPTRLGPRVAELAGLFRSAIERGGIEYTVDIAEDKWAEKRPFYLADEMVEKVIFNVIGNAFKYTQAGSVQVKVRFAPTEGTITVKDTGVGIKEDDLSKIWDRFHRSDSSARSFEGTGIGLSLVLELVRAMGGTIAVESEYQKGSTFTIKLPRGKEHLAPEVIEEQAYEAMALPPRAAQTLSIINDATSWRTQPNVDANKGPLAVARAEAVKDRQTLARRPSDPDDMPSVFNLEKASTVCLIVDDNAQLRAFIGEILAKTFTVVEAANGQEALEYALEHPVSIVLTDLAMPVMNGRELLAALRNDPRTSLIPVIFLSAQAGAEARVDALLLGADDYVTKPFQARELLARTNTHLQIGKMRTELERRVTERTAALIESETKYRQLADQHQTLALVSPVGIFQTDSKGHIIFANPRYYDISGHPQDVSHDEWEADVYPEDRPKLKQLWAEAIETWKPDRGVITCEYRYQHRGNWVQMEIRSFDKGYIGSITDISHQKEVEASHVKVVEQRADDAEENRRQTEMFLDMSSHELRNPLSGVWQNAEVVAASLEKFTAWLDELKGVPSLDQDVIKEMHDEMVENLDAVESIQICASHQTRIADDILNVSKLNMGLLSINVAPFDIVAAIREVVRTFGTSAQQQEIQLRIDRGESLDRLDVEYIVADAGRLKQVTYNFLTNALKYTGASATKTVIVHVDVYDEAPPESPNAMRISSPGQSFEPPPGCIWCIVGVEDSGKGLTPDELKLLFARFSQANPRSDQYGGSGLGLYVSKKLIELHRGFIEVASEPGMGSTFRFAVPASRAPRPAPTEATSGVPGQNLGLKRLKRPISSSGRAATLSHSASSDATPTVDGGSASPTPDPAHLPALRVLIVEDNLINQKVMIRQLKQQGLEVSVANDGQQALDLLQEDAEKIKSKNTSADKNAIAPFDGISVVLMDIEMPVMDGLTAIRELRRREKTGEIAHHYPVCAVTGNAREAQKAECLKAGFDDVTIKPYKMTEVLQQISQLTGYPLPTAQK